jgi:hypothetical protein
LHTGRRQIFQTGKHRAGALGNRGGALPVYIENSSELCPLGFPQYSQVIAAKGTNANNGNGNS